MISLLNSDGKVLARCTANVTGYNNIEDSGKTTMPDNNNKSHTVVTPDKNKDTNNASKLNENSGSQKAAVPNTKGNIGAEAETNNNESKPSSQTDKVSPVTGIVEKIENVKDYMILYVAISMAVAAAVVTVVVLMKKRRY